MDKTINGKPVKAVVEFEHFLFTPNFNLGNHAATVSLVAYSPETGYIKTSEVVGIHEEEGENYIETRNSVYKLSKKRRTYHLKDVKKYLDGEIDAKAVYDQSVANEMPSKSGWRIY